MRHLKLFEEYELINLQDVEDFLDDKFAELLDEWGFCQRDSVYDIVNADKIYLFIMDHYRRNVSIMFCINANDASIKLDDFYSDVNKIYSEKVKNVFKMSTITCNRIKITDDLDNDIKTYYVMVNINADGKNDGSF